MQLATGLLRSVDSGDSIDCIEAAVPGDRSYGAKLDQIVLKVV